MLLIIIYLNMKKVFFGAAALLCSGAIFAQANQGPLEDINGGVSTDAEVVAAEAGAASTANTGWSMQNGNDQKVYVRQAGTNMSVFTDQGDGDGTGGNQARIWQTGAVSAASGIENAADVRQFGTENQSTTRQEGDRNEAVTRQGLNDAASASNKALIRQGTADQAENNYAAIEQDGTENQAWTRQTYDNSEARTVQVGNKNAAKVIQVANPNDSAGHSAIVEQYGDENSAVTMQNGSARNAARTAQLGNGNQSFQTQSSSAASGLGNNADVDQGTGQVVSTLVTDIYFGGLENVDDITSGGGFNGTSTAGLAIQDQTGENNNAFIGQFGSADADSNYAEQNQSGKDNEALTVQNAFGAADGGNYSRQDQSGEANQAGISQIGSMNRAYQRQNDANNIALTTQRGWNHVVNTYQDGHGANVVTTAQRGDKNTILAVQRGGHSYSVEQNVQEGLETTNGGNIADILQLGPNGDFEHDGIECEFEDPKSPNMDFDIQDFNIANPCDDC